MSRPYLIIIRVTSFNSLSSGVFTTTTASSLNAGGGLGALGRASPTIPTSTVEGGTMANEIDRIMAKIEQDNKILAELDKSRATIGPGTNRHVKFLDSPLLGLQIREAAKSLLRGSKKLTKYTNEYYRKYRSMTQAEKLRNYLLQHSQQRQPRHLHRHGSGRHDSSGHRRKDTSHHIHHCCCGKIPAARRTEAYECPIARRPETYEYKSKCTFNGPDFSARSKVFPDPHSQAKQYKPCQNFCDSVHCPYQYYSEPHLFSESKPFSTRDAKFGSSGRAESRHVRFLQPLHTSAPNLGCKNPRVLPVTPHESFDFSSFGGSSLSQQLKGYLTVPRPSTFNRRQRFEILMVTFDDSGVILALSVPDKLEVERSNKDSAIQLECA
ncbi:hypothetical protein HAZT_HAZT005741 [Hyalella azteca]|uniref:Uncharacterized protein n=1 Tax=Hyalella azteca TaxID=294128 RepID=A0A6A0H7F6_HYAAZ|nr:hypothetical protein HAZT_HAZT005741 [Hyalella azteca]